MGFRGAVYFDRDGTIIEGVPYLHAPEQLRLIPGAGEALARLNTAGYAVVLVTNQSGVARGYFPESAVHAVHARLEAELAGVNAHLDGIFYCPHHPDGKLDAFRKTCSCRKPAPGMIEKAREQLKLDGGREFVVGDNDVDVGLALATGAEGFLVRTGYGRKIEAVLNESGKPPVRVVDSLVEAVSEILEKDPRRLPKTHFRMN